MVLRAFSETSGITRCTTLGTPAAAAESGARSLRAGAVSLPRAGAAAAGVGVSREFLGAEESARGGALVAGATGGVAVAAVSSLCRDAGSEEFPPLRSIRG